MRRPKMIGSASATAKYGGYLEGFLATPKGQTTFSAFTINYCYSLREELETLISSAPANNYCHSLREGLKTLTSFASINNYSAVSKKGWRCKPPLFLSTTKTADLERGWKHSSDLQLLFHLLVALTSQKIQPPALNPLKRATLSGVDIVDVLG